MTTSTYTAYLIMLLAAWILNLSALVAVWPRRRAPGGMTLAAVLLLVMIILAATGLSMASPDAQSALFWHFNVRFPCFAILGPLVLQLLLQYLDYRSWRAWWWQCSLFAIPAISIGLMWTNPLHHLFAQSYDMVLMGRYFVRESWMPGVWFPVHALYGYAILIVTVIVFLTQIRQHTDTYRQQIWVLLVAIFPAVALSIVDTLQLLPGLGLQLLPLGMALTGPLFTLALTRYGLLDIVPVAYESMFSSIEDPVIALHNDGRVLALNPAAQRLSAPDGKATIGSALADVMPDLARCLARLEPDKTGCQFEHNGQTYDLRIASLRRRDHVLGQLLELRDITDRKEAEAQLRRQAHLLENISDAIIASDRNGRIVSWNRAAESVYGWQTHEAIGHDISDFLTTSYLAGETRSTVTAEIAAEGQWRGEIKQVRKDGKLLHVQAAASLLRDSAGTPTGIVTINRDITELKQAEAALVDAKNFLQQIVDSSPSMIFVVDSQGRLDFVNQYAAQYYESTPEQLISQSTYDVHGQDKETQEFIHDDQDVIRTRTKIVKEEMNTAPNGEVHWFQTVKVPLTRIDGTVEVLGISTDITERKLAEAAIQERELRLAGIVGAAMDAIISVDKKQRIVVFNEAAERIFRIPAAEAMGQPLDRFIPERFRAGHKKHIRDFGRTRVSSRTMTSLGKLTGIRGDGEEFPIEASISQLTVSDKKLFTVILRDITDRSLAEKAEREQYTLAEALRDTAEALNSTLKLDEVLDRILDNVQHVVPHDAASLMMIESGIAHVVRGHGYAARGMRETVTSVRFPIAQTADMAHMVETHKPNIVVDVRSEPGWITVPGQEWVRSVLAAPILWSGKVAGFVFLNSAEPDAFTIKHAETLRAFADQAGTAIHNAKLYERERRARALAQAFQKATEGMSRFLDIGAALDLIADLLGDVIPFDRVLMMLIDEEHLTPIVARGFPENTTMLQAAYSYADNPAIYHSLTEGEVLFVPGLAKTDAGQIILPAFTPLTSGWIGVPLVASEVIIGYLVSATDQEGGYRSEDVEALKAFAQQAVLAISRSRLMDELQVTQAHLTRIGHLSAAGELAAGVAHQINNPLTAVVAQTYLLMKDSPPNSVAFQRARKIREAADRASSIVQRMLDFSRAVPDDMQPLDINTSLQEAVDLVRPQIEPDVAQLVITLAPGLPSVKGSATHLHDSWVNLLLNACDAVKAVRNARIEVSTCLSDDGTTIKVQIADNGPGIPADRRVHIFDPFYTTKPQGTGLGLAICQDVIARHGGSIHLRDDVSPGAVFEILLPVATQIAEGEH